MNNISKFRSGKFVAKNVSPRNESEKLPEEAIQSNGVDLSINKILECSGKSKINNDDYELPNRKEIELKEDYYKLQSDKSYVVIYDEIINIPDDHIGFVFPRSRLMRCSMYIETAVWDSGYEGIGEGGLVVHNSGDLHKDLRLAQITLIPSEDSNYKYDGTHQGEKL